MGTGYLQNISSSCSSRGGAGLAGLEVSAHQALCVGRPRGASLCHGSTRHLQRQGAGKIRCTILPFPGLPGTASSVRSELSSIFAALMLCLSFGWGYLQMVALAPRLSCWSLEWCKSIRAEGPALLPASARYPHACAQGSRQPSYPLSALPCALMGAGGATFPRFQPSLPPIDAPYPFSALCRKTHETHLQSGIYQWF